LTHVHQDERWRHNYGNELNAELVSAETEVSSSMKDVLHATRSVILLTDADGVILESFGAQRHINYAAERNLHAARVGSFYLLLKQKGSIYSLV
jgi:transcriptional regulator of acetoin/glycerol metabolism